MAELSPSDHDLLISLDTKMSMFLERSDRDAKDTVERFGIVEKSLGTAHRRIDGITFNGILAIILLSLSSLGALVMVFFHNGGQ